MTDYALYKFTLLHYIVESGVKMWAKRTTYARQNTLDCIALVRYGEKRLVMRSGPAIDCSRPRFSGVGGGMPNENKA